ncbi:uncharacterized protein LOC121411618 [Lytechinus variegatus]|uniref:uncharacterized protein LOC121411618 n=1 Tax=Lytechinus variegatus TaxID=7654 RepID=UPI001BB1BC82|nr:uncharacterized protein LOC121411618 [Lytechinus variegatus]
MEPTVVPVGWKRAIVNEKVVYMSPSGQLLQSTEAVQTYLSSDGTCKCGLECPINLDKVFNFDPRVLCKPRTAQEASNDNGLTNLCNHKRKVVAMATWLDSVETAKVEDDVTANNPGPSKSRPIPNFATEMQFPNFPTPNSLPNSMHPGTMPQMNQMNYMHHIDSIPFDAHMQRNTIEAQQHQMRMLYEFHQQFGTNLKQRKPKNQGEFFAGNQHMQQQIPFTGQSVPGMSPPRFAYPGMPRYPRQRFPFPGEFNQQHPGAMRNLHPGVVPRGMPQGMMSPQMGNMFPRPQHSHVANNQQMCMPGMYGEDVSMYVAGPTSPTFPGVLHPGIRPKKKRSRSADQVKVPTTCSPIQHVLCESDTRSMSASNLLSIAAKAQLANKQQQEAVCKMPNLASQLLQLPHEELTKLIKAHQQQAKMESNEKDANSEQLSTNPSTSLCHAAPTDNPSENLEMDKSIVQEPQSIVDGDGDASHHRETAENEEKESVCKSQCEEISADQEKLQDSEPLTTPSSPSQAKCVSQKSESFDESSRTLASEIEDVTDKQTVSDEPVKCEKSEPNKESSSEVQSSNPKSNHPLEHVMNEEELHRLKMEQEYLHALPGNVQQPLRAGYPVEMIPGMPTRMPVPPGHVVPRMPGIPELGAMGYPPVPWGGLQNPTFAMHETELDFAPSKKRKRKAKNQRSISADGLFTHSGMVSHQQIPQMIPFHSPDQPAMPQMVVRNPHMNPPHNPVPPNHHEYPHTHIPGMVRPPFPDQQLVIEQQNINSLPVIVQSALEDAQLRNMLPQLQQQRLYMKTTGPKKVKDMLADLRNSNQTAVTSANSEISSTSKDVTPIAQSISETINTTSTNVPISQAVKISQQTLCTEGSQTVIELDPQFSLPRDSIKTCNATGSEPLSTIYYSSNADSSIDPQHPSEIAVSEPVNEQYSSILSDSHIEDMQTIGQNQDCDNSKDSLNNCGTGNDEVVTHPAAGANIDDAPCVTRQEVSETIETSMEVLEETSEADGTAVDIACSTSSASKTSEAEVVHDPGNLSTPAMPSESEEQEVATLLLSMTDQPLNSPFSNSSEKCHREDNHTINLSTDVSHCKDEGVTLESGRQVTNNECSTQKEQSNESEISVVTCSLPVAGIDSSMDQVAQMTDGRSDCCMADELTINQVDNPSSSFEASQDQVFSLENARLLMQETENVESNLECVVSTRSDVLPMNAACDDKAKDSPQSQDSSMSSSQADKSRKDSCERNPEPGSEADAEVSSKWITTETENATSRIQLSSEVDKEIISQVKVQQCIPDMDVGGGEGNKLVKYEQETETDSELSTAVENSGSDNQLRTDPQIDIKNAKELCNVEEECQRGSMESFEGVSSGSGRLLPECNVNSNNSNSGDHVVQSEEIYDVDLNSNTKPAEALSGPSEGCADSALCDVSVIDIPGESVKQVICEESVGVDAPESVLVNSPRSSIDLSPEKLEDQENTSSPCGLNFESNGEEAKEGMSIHVSNQVQDSVALLSERTDEDFPDSSERNSAALEDIQSSENRTESQEPQRQSELTFENTAAVQDVKQETKCTSKDCGASGGRVALRDSSVSNIQEVFAVPEMIKKPADQSDSVTSVMDRPTDNGIVGDVASCSPTRDDEPSFTPEFETGDLVWGQIRGYSSWPGKLVSDAEVKGQKKKEEGKVWVMWFGDHSFTQVEPTKLKTLTEGLEAHHKARTRHRTRHRTLTSSLEAAIQEAMMELDNKAEQANEKKRKAGARGRSRLKRPKIR